MLFCKLIFLYNSYFHILAYNTLIASWESVIPKLTPGLFNHTICISNLVTSKNPQSTDIPSNQIPVRTGASVCYSNASLRYVSVFGPFLSQKDWTASKEDESDPNFA